MKYAYLFFLFLLPAVSIAQPYTHQDTLRGSNGRGRSWWDVQRYDLNIYIDTATKTISGSNEITFKVISAPNDSMQIDLQDSLKIDWVGIKTISDSVVYNEGYAWDFNKEGNIWWIDLTSTHLDFKQSYKMEIRFHGKPPIAKHAPWDGGFIWTEDSLNNPWIAVACQGLGASSWWPCKDYQGDEPESGMNLMVGINRNTDTSTLVTVANGRLNNMFVSESIVNEDLSFKNGKGQILIDNSNMHGWAYHIKNPINTYSTTFYIGDYAHWQDTFQGEKGILNLDFYPLKYNEAKARKHWAVVKDMLRCYEYWLGPYPFYEDGYKLVEAPYLGMEHQSAIAYGNEYKMGYRGHTLGGSVGMLFDYIIIHESGHEWFGNSITAQDIADNWLHEGFTTYTETLFAQWITNRDKAFEYVAGEWDHITNDYPVIGDYGVNDDKGSDKYYKGAAVVHMIRMMLNDDEQFRRLLRGLNKDFYHKITTSAEVEAYISKFVGKDLTPFFDQYLRTKDEPVLEWYVAKKQFHYRWQHVTDNFSAPFILKERDQQEVIPDNDSSRFANRKFRKRNLSIAPCGWYEIRERNF